ncbi:DUF490 domain-containing protein [Vandammella animalimorsus]|uniref:DUF490 domain-containing protein n=2 Tax=Vandammella animalimorsus TaxID=2029117 RepID=A0A2A2T2D0_9BURK|nr:DUF490 domain-containing protein [Vandammella animalimorsus]PAX15590.1 DUF490 domain-containing protein [Vandammella animalimorsus]PAX17587.1 DUF490 domain-containing protein [Vandammella animalimorsus]
MMNDHTRADAPPTDPSIAAGRVPAAPIAAGHDQSARRPRRRWLRALLWLLLGLVLLLALAVGGLWWWASRDGSLPRALALAQRYLPAGHTLDYSQAQGSITGGGQIGTLQWQMPGVALHIDDLRLDWTLSELLGRALHVRTLQAERLHVRLTPQPDAPPPPEQQPFVMPDSLALPLRSVQLPLQVQTLEIETVDATGQSQSQVLQDLRAHYRYDAPWHALQLHSLHYGQSQAQGLVRLHAQQLDLQATLGAWLHDVVPQTPQTMQALLTAEGTLAGGPDAQLQLQLQAQERAATASAPADLLAAWAVEAAETAAEASKAAQSSAPQAAAATDSAPQTAAKTPAKPAVKPAASAAAQAQLQLQAQIHPWRRLPLGQSRVQLAHINAQAFHAQAPATDLYGTLTLAPQNPAPAAQAQDPWAAPWQLQAEIDNRQPGNWDAQQLPVRRLQALLHYAPEAVRIEQATVELEGRAPAGRLQLSGQADPQRWNTAELDLALHAIDLQALQASLPHTRLSGQAKLRPAPGTPLAQAPDGAPHGAQPDWLQSPWQIDAELRNAQAGPLDRQRLPLAQLLTQLQIAPERWSVQTLQAHFGAAAASAETAAQAGPAHLQLQGHFAPQTQALAVQGELQQLPLQAVHGELASAQAPSLSGAFSAQGQLEQDIAFEADIRGTGAAQAGSGAAWAVRTIQAKGRWQPQLLDVQQLQLDALGAKVEASKLQVALPAAERIEAVLSASAPGLSLQADTAMQQAAGAGKLALQVASAEQLLAWLRGMPVVGAALPPLQAQGALQFEADWNGGWQQWLQGLQKPAAHPQLRLAAKAHSQGLRIVLPAADSPAQAQTKAKGKTQKKTPAKPASQAPGTQLAIRALQLQLEGNLAAATLALHGDVRANDAQAVLDARARMSQAQATGGASAAWDIAIEQLAAAATLPGQTGPWRLQVADGLRLKLHNGQALRVDATAGQASLTPPAQVARQGEALQLRWEPLQWQQRPGGAMQLQSRGQFSGLVVGWVDALLPQQRPLQAAGLHSSLVLQGNWDIDMGQQLRVQAALQRSSGELWLGEPSAAQAAAAVAPGTTVQSNAPRRRGVAAGIKNLALRLQSQGEQLQATLDWDTERAGTVQAQVQTRLAKQGGGWALPADAPLDGRVQAKVQDLGVWAGLAPLGWRIAGALEADVRLAGTLQAPQLQGPIRARQLNVRSVLDGVDLHDGRLEAQLQGSRLQIEELVLHGGTGSNAYVPGLSGNRTPAPVERGRMVASGVLDWSGAAGAAGTGLALDVKAQLEQMQVLVRNDRQMSLSGTLQAALADGALRVRGDVRVDRAAITLPESQAPVLGDDVLVVRRGVPQDQVAPKSAKQRAEEKAEKQAEQEEGEQPRGQLKTAKPMDLRIQLDLGRDFALQGYGITTRLEGNLTVTSTAKGPGPVSVVGEIRTDEGRYRAWGQALNVERGVVRFNGPYANPSIDMLAVRPNIDVRAGVRVTGTAQAPRVRLYSEPSLPESEALSWVVLGRAPGAGSGGGNAMQQAALGLLAGSVGDSLAGGLGFDEVGLSQSGVSIGKRLSDQLYITYEAGLSGAASTLYVFYDITRRLTARGQTGQTSAVDLIYTISYD